MSKWFISLLTVVFITGCAVSSHYQGRRALGKGNYEEAVILFEEALETSPNDPRILTDLGVAHFRKDDAVKAIEYLGKAKSSDPMYGRAYLYLGMVYEKQDDLPKAISEYNAYYQQSPLTPMGLKLKARMGALMRKQIAKEVKEAIKKEKSLDVDSIPENTLAVSYFSNLTGDEEYDALQKGLADMMITDLSQVESLKVLERARLQILMDELELSASGISDASTAPRIGRLLGARRIVSGGIAAPGEGQFRMDAIAANVATDETEAQADAMGDQARFFLMEKELVFDILDDLNVALTQEERDAIQKLPTESFLAFLAYSRGLDYEDRGMYREAAGQYQKAAEIDPGFSQASEKSQEVQTLAETPMTGSPQETEQLAQDAEEEEIAGDGTGEEPGFSSENRLNSMDGNTTKGYFPSPDADPSDDRTPPQQQTRTTVNVTIEL